LENCLKINPVYFLSNLINKKISKTIKKATETKPNTIARIENKFLNAPDFRALYNMKETEVRMTKNIKFREIKIIFLLLERTSFLPLLGILLALFDFLELFLPLFFLAIIC
jgi:hypothetical protein